MPSILDDGRALAEHIGVAGSSPALLTAYGRIARAAAWRCAVLVHGEPGTGKADALRAFHVWSSRRDRPYLVIDAGSVVESLIESELFGVVRGAATGVGARKGMVREAAGGTVAIDEIHHLPIAAQAALLRLLQDREVRPVGSDQTFKVDVRIVAATNRDLDAEAAAGRFLPDLLDRLTFRVEMPPLRDRLADLPALARSVYERAWAEEGPGGERPALTDDHLALLVDRDWPGNVRELRAVLIEAAILGQDHLALAEALASRGVDRGGERGGDRGGEAGSPDGERVSGVEESVEETVEESWVRPLTKAEQERWRRLRAAKKATRRAITTASGREAYVYRLVRPLRERSSP